MKITPTIAAPQVARILQLLPKEPIVEAPVAQKDTFEKNKVVPITFAYDKRGDAVISGQRPPDASFQVHEYARNLIGDLNNALHTIGANADMIRVTQNPAVRQPKTQLRSRRQHKQQQKLQGNSLHTRITKKDSQSRVI